MGFVAQGHKSALLGLLPIGDVQALVTGGNPVLLWVMWFRDTSLPYWSCSLLVMFRLWYRDASLSYCGFCCSGTQVCLIGLVAYW